MKVSRLAAILIVIGILVSASVVAVFVYGVAQNDRIALISVRTDKPSYGAGENVTFKLIDNTPNIDFNMTEPINGFLDGEHSLGTINIVRIPDGIDPDWVVDHLLVNEDLSTKPFLGESYLATIHYDYFTSKHSPLNMSWDGKIGASNIFTEGAATFPATSGNSGPT